MARTSPRSLPKRPRTTSPTSGTHSPRRHYRWASRWSRRAGWPNPPPTSTACPKENSPCSRLPLRRRRRRSPRWPRHKRARQSDNGLTSLVVSACYCPHPRPSSVCPTALLSLPSLLPPDRILWRKSDRWPSPACSSLCIPTLPPPLSLTHTHTLFLPAVV